MQIEHRLLLPRRGYVSPFKPLLGASGEVLLFLENPRACEPSALTALQVVGSAWGRSHL